MGFQVMQVFAHLVLGNKIVGIEEKHPNNKKGGENKIETAEKFRDSDQHTRLYENKTGTAKVLLLQSLKLINYSNSLTCFYRGNKQFLPALLRCAAIGCTWPSGRTGKQSLF
jgi:hypothetical protein